MYTEIPLPYCLENRKDTPSPKTRQTTHRAPQQTRSAFRADPSKIFEKIIYSHLLKHLNKHDTIILQQFGFRQKYSYIQQFQRVTEYATIEMSKNRITQLILLDLEKVFDSVWDEALLHKLHKIHTSTIITKLVRQEDVHCNQRSQIRDSAGQGWSPTGIHTWPHTI